MPGCEQTKRSSPSLGGNISDPTTAVISDVSRDKHDQIFLRVVKTGSDGAEWKTLEEIVVRDDGSFQLQHPSGISRGDVGELPADVIAAVRECIVKIERLGSKRIQYIEGIPTYTSGIDESNTAQPAGILKLTIFVFEFVSKKDAAQKKINPALVPAPDLFLLASVLRRGWP